MQENTNLGMEQVQDDFWENDDFFEQTGEEENLTQHDDRTQAQEEGADGENQPETPERGENQPEQAAQTIRVKYNGQNMDVPISQAQALIQKGMNYDRVLGERDSLRASPQFGFLEKLAKGSGKSVEQYMQDVSQAMEQREIRELTAQGMTERAAQELLGARADQAQTKRELDELKAQVAAQQQERGKSEMLREFFTRHPDVNPKDIPQDVLQAVGKGRDLESAWTAHQNKQLLERIKELETKVSTYETGKANAQKSVGSIAASAPPKDEIDEVWEAFMKG